MDRLSALDASFLYGETPESPMHVAGLAIFDPPPADTNIFAAFRDHLKSRLHLVPFFERKLALAPIQLDHPVWVSRRQSRSRISFPPRLLAEAGNARAARDPGGATAHDPARSQPTALAVLCDRGSGERRLRGLHQDAPRWHRRRRGHGCASYHIRHLARSGTGATALPDNQGQQASRALRADPRFLRQVLHPAAGVLSVVARYRQSDRESGTTRYGGFGEPTSPASRSHRKPFSMRRCRASDHLQPAPSRFAKRRRSPS